MTKIEQQLQENIRVLSMITDNVEHNDNKDYVKSSQLDLLQSVVEWLKTQEVKESVPYTDGMVQEFETGYLDMDNVIDHLTKIIEENK